MKTHPPPDGGGERPGGGAPARYALALLALIALLTCALRYRLLDVPLERDEGGFAYMGQLLLDGTPPYTQAYDYKPPGLYIAYASFIALFGASPPGIHAGLLLSSLASMTLLFALVRRWSDTPGALVAALLLQILLLSPSVLGFAAHATHFVVVFSLAGWLLAERSLDRGSRAGLIAAGAAFGCALLMKQPGAAFLLAAMALPFVPGRAGGRAASASIAASGLLLGGALIPVAAVAGWLAAAGALDEARFWLLTYPAAVGSEAGVTGIVPRFVRNAVQASGNFLPVWFAGAAGFAAVASGRGRLRLPPGIRARYALFAAASAASVFGGYETRSHYFVLVLGAIAAASGIAASRIGGLLRSRRLRLLVTCVPCILAAIGVVKEREYFFSAGADAISRTIYAPNQFADAGGIAAFIRGSTSDTDRVAVLGSEPEILFLSGRRSATRYIFTNFFHERHGMGGRMEREMIGEIDSAAPAVIVLVNQGFSWGAMPRREWPVMKWAAEYTARYYELAGVVTPVSAHASRYAWGGDARAIPGADRAPVVIYRRIRDARAPSPPR